MKNAVKARSANMSFNIFRKIFREKIIFLAALTLCLCFCAAALEAENFLSACTIHECCGDGCIVCLRLLFAQDMLVQAAVRLCVAVTGFFVLRPSTFCNGVPTGVELRVRLNR